MFINEIWDFKSINMAHELGIAGEFIYDSARKAMALRNLYNDYELNSILYNGAVGIERLQKIYLCLSIPNPMDKSTVPECLKKHNHNELEKHVKEYSGKCISANGRSLLGLFSEYYNNYRYANYVPGYNSIKLVLLTQSNEYIRPTDEDFFIDSDGQSVTEFRIECLLEDFTNNEAKNFIEYLDFCKVGDKIIYSMHLYYKAWKEKNRIFSELRIGDAVDGVVMDGRARELLKAVYLKPLRDAEREMSSGRNSRISQILLGHPIFSKQDGHKLIDILKDANQNVEKYFSEDDGKVILRSIKSTLDAFNESDNTSDARFETSDYQLKAILESLSLTVPETHPGLGELNLLFMAAELLLLKHDDNGCLKLALIEELEAHLHPQAQLRLISYLQNEYNESGAQIIVSTHSTMLASKINLKNIVLLKNGVGYDLSYGKTGLEKGDYLFLQRFLDTSKANLFFARGIIMVEGDAENILIPTLAEIIGLPLEKHGVSVVNVGSTAFLRYSRILTRADHSSVSIPVAIITDCDVRPEYKEDGSFDKKLMETTTKVGDKESYYSVDTIKGFIAPRWTLEYCLALSALASDFHKAMVHLLEAYGLPDPYHGQIQYARVFQNRKQFDQFFHGLEDKYAFHKLWLDTKVREHLAFMLIYFGYFNTIPLMVKRIPLPVGQELTDEEMETVCNQILFILGASFDGEMNQLMSELDERIVDSVYKLDLNRPKKSMMRKNMDNMDMKYCMKRLSTRTVLGKSQENIFRLIMDIVYKEKNIDESKMSDQEYDDFIKSAAPKVYDEIKSDIEAFDQKLQQFAKDNGIKKGKLSEGDLPDEGYSITLRELLEGKEPISNTERKKRMGQ